MGIFSVIGNEVTKAVDYVVEKNRKAAMINRLRIVIKNERENTARAMLRLENIIWSTCAIRRTHRRSSSARL